MGLDGFQDVLFAFFAEAFEIAEFVFLGELFDIGYRAGFEFLPEQGDFLRA